MKKIISAEELHALTGEAKTSIIDANWFLPTDDKTGRQEFIKKRIPGAVFFDIDACCDKDSPLPHSLPAADIFTDTMRQLGVGNDDKIVVYDRMGYFSAPRLFWMLHHFGHDETAILDGGLQAWEAAGLPTESGTENADAASVKGDFSITTTSAATPAMVADKGDVLQAIGSATAIIDARSAARFSGTAPEPRPGLRSGHIPGAGNVPFDECFDKATGLFKTAAELQKLFAGKIPTDHKQEIICSCGSGITACTVILALEILGYRNVKLYDGSWAEWGADNNLPIATGNDSG